MVGGRGEVAAASPLTIEKGLLFSQANNNSAAGSALIGEVTPELKGLFTSALYTNERGFKPKISSSAINYSGPPQAHNFHAYKQTLFAVAAIVIGGIVGIMVSLLIPPVLPAWFPAWTAYLIGWVSAFFSFLSGLKYVRMGLAIKKAGYSLDRANSQPPATYDTATKLVTIDPKNALPEWVKEELTVHENAHKEGIKSELRVFLRVTHLSKFLMLLAGIAAMFYGVNPYLSLPAFAYAMAVTFLISSISQYLVRNHKIKFALSVISGVSGILGITSGVLIWKLNSSWIMATLAGAAIAALMVKIYADKAEGKYWFLLGVSIDKLKAQINNALDRIKGNIWGGWDEDLWKEFRDKYGLAAEATL